MNKRLKFKQLALFFLQAIKYFLKKNRVTFAKVSKNLDLSQYEGKLTEAFAKNELSSSHHSLLYEPAFEHQEFGKLLCAYFPATFTDIYWGDFIAKNISIDEIAKAMKLAKSNAKRHSRFCCFVDISQEVASELESYDIPYKKYYIGDEWITKVQKFDLNGWQKRNFRNAHHSAERNGLKMVLADSNEFNTLNEVIRHFDRMKHLDFPRVGAAKLQPPIHPDITRKVWKIVDSTNRLLGGIVAARIGEKSYFFEHVFYCEETHSNFLFDWAFSEVILRLKDEGIEEVSWGKVSHIITPDDIQQNQDLWLIKRLHKIFRLEKFTQATMNFKQDFQPIIRKPKYLYYHDFNAFLFLDLMDVIGYFSKINKFLSKMSNFQK